MIMELDLTAKDKYALKSLSVDLRDMLRMKKVDDRVEHPEYDESLMLHSSKLWTEIILMRC